MLKTETSDWELIVAAKGSDRDAFRQLYDRYEGDLRLHVCRLLGPEYCVRYAQDVCSDTWLKALENIQTFNTMKYHVFGPWLVTIARNVVSDLFRNLHYEQRAANFPPYVTTMHYDLARATTAELLQLALELAYPRLSHADEFLALERGELTVMEVGRKLKMSRDAVYQMRKRNRGRILQELARRGLTVI